MILHYFRVAWRHIRHQKLYSGINILGLSVGICACTVIFLVARFDLGYDKFHPDRERIYRIVGEAHTKDGASIFVNSPFEDIAGIEHEIPGFEEQIGFHTYRVSITIPAEGRRPAKEFGGSQEGGYAAATILTGPAFFSLFPHRWLLGNASVLNEPGKLVLTETAARKYFGSGPLEKMLGRTVVYEDSLLVSVGGIVGDWDRLSDLNYTNFISIATAPGSWLRAAVPTTDWRSLQPHRSQAFVKLAKGIDPAVVNAALASYIQRQQAGIFGRKANVKMYLQPLGDMHYTPEYYRGDDGDDFRKAYMPMLYALMGVALFILALAAINFINLSSAQSLQRVKEVGIRKVMGSSRKGLVYQFLIETLLLTAAALLLSLAFVKPAMILFAEYIPQGVRFHVLDGGNLLFLLTLLTCVTLLAGLYPAWLLSSYVPALSLKGMSHQTGRGRSGLRKALIVFQFSISMIFIIGALGVSRQIRYMRDADKGFTSDAILTINKWRARPEEMKVLAQEIRKQSGVREVILQGNAPMGFAHGGATFVYKGKEVKGMTVSVEAGDAGFIPFYGMKLKAGRNILAGDSVRELVVNETYARALGFENISAVVGKTVYENDIAYTVVGVVSDFHEDSFRETIKPMVIQNEIQREKSVAVKLATTGMQTVDAKPVLAGIEAAWKKVFPRTPFQYSFLNESITWLYQQETHAAWLIQAATAIAIFISCMGLFGLALFTAGKRAKEIGIRKVLGASVAGISLLLSREFLLLVVIAIGIASPLAWYLTDMWLGSFAYRTGMSAWVLLEAGLAAIGLALLTVSGQAIRAAVVNPVESLRAE